MGFFSFLKGKSETAPKASDERRPSLPKNHLSDWQTSSAHLFLLSRFLTGQDAATFSKHYWEVVLQETPQRALDRFIAEGWLIPASLLVKLRSASNAKDIKAFLKEHGLPVSGTKEQGIERLVASDPDGMAKKVVHLNVYECSPDARIVAERFVAIQNEKRQVAEVIPPFLAALRSRVD